jgi:hypothetical protein
MERIVWLEPVFLALFTYGLEDIRKIFSGVSLTHD